MATDFEREPLALVVEDDPMRTFAPRNGNRAAPAIGDPAPLGLAALGLTLLVFSMFATALLAASGEPVVSVMLLALTVAFLLVGIGDAGAHAELAKIGGWFGLVAGAAGLYGAFAGAINGTWARTVLPLVPLRRAAG